MRIFATQTEWQQHWGAVRQVLRRLPLLRLFQAVLLVGVVLYLASVVTGDMVRAVVEMWRSTPWLVVLSAVLFAANTLVSATAWYGWLRALGVSLPLHTSLYVWYTSMLARYLPGGMLHVGSRIVLGRTHGVPVRVGLVALFLEQGAAVAWAILFALSLGLHILPLPVLGAGVLVTAVILWIRVMEAGHPINWLLQWLGRKPVMYRLSPGCFLGVMSLYAWAVVLGSSGLFVLLAPTLGVSRLLAVSVAAIASLSWLAGFLSPLPGGLGVREAAMSVLLTNVLGMASSSAVGITVLARLLIVVAEVLAWLVVTGLHTGLARSRTASS